MVPGVRAVAEPAGAVGNRLGRGLQIVRRAADDAQDFARGGLLRLQRDIDTELTSLEGLTRVDARNVVSLPAELNKRLSEWKGLLGRHPAQARQIARKLVEGRLTLTPLQDDRGRFYEAKGQGTLGRVLGPGRSLLKPW